MKRILIALLVSGMIISQTTGCGGSSKTVESRSTESSPDTRRDGED